MLGTAEKVVEWQPLALIEGELEAEAQGLALRLAEGVREEDALEDPHEEGSTEALGVALADTEKELLPEGALEMVVEGDGVPLKEGLALGLENGDVVAYTLEDPHKVGGADALGAPLLDYEMEALPEGAVETVARGVAVTLKESVAEGLGEALQHSPSAARPVRWEPG